MVSIERVFEKRNVVSIPQNESILSQPSVISLEMTSPITKPGPNSGPGFVRIHIHFNQECESGLFKA